MIKVKRIGLSKMHLLEVRSLIKEVTAIVEWHNPEALNLGNIYDLLLEQKEKIELLKSPYGRHPLTGKYKDFHEMRLAYVALITTNMRSIAAGKFNHPRHLIPVAYPIVKSYLFYLRKENRIVVGQRIRGFMQQLEKNPEEMEAFVTLGFKKDIENLKKANEECINTAALRLTDKSKRPRVDKKLIAREAEDVIRLLVDQINQYQRSYKNLDYTLLVNELNELLTEYSKNINTRTTINKRSAKKKKEAAEKKTALDNKVKTDLDPASKQTTQSTDITTTNQTSNLPARIDKNWTNEHLQKLIDMLKSLEGNKDKGKNEKKNKGEDKSKD